jgi:uncharacterized protein (TIGR03086 family)
MGERESDILMGLIGDPTEDVLTQEQSTVAPDPVRARIVQRACGSTQAVLDAVTPADLERPTPCKSWTVSGVIKHLVGSAGYFAGLAGNGNGNDDDEEPELSGDFKEAFGREAARMVAAFNGPGVLDKIMKMPIGDLPGSVCIWIAAGDIFAHGWDLAKATGQPTDLDPELAEMMLERISSLLSDSMRGPEGMAPFGPKVDVPASAPAADRLAGYLGRAV